MKFKRKNINDQQLVQLYQSLLLPRLIEERMLVLLRQGKISKWFSGIGQEAVSVGVAAALDDNDYGCTVHRNLGFFTTRNIPLARLFAQFQGKASGYTSGRDRSFHFGDHETKVVGMISHLAAQLNVANGIALAEMLQKTGQITVAFTGDGGTSEGDFHEAMNVASVWNLPVLFVIESNGYGLSTPSDEQFKVRDLADRAAGYGMKSKVVDGNNVLEVFKATESLRKHITDGNGPALLECKTFRVRGHEEASGVAYVPETLIEQWEAKDPVVKFEEFLLQQGVLTDVEIGKTRKQLEAGIKTEWKVALAAEEPDHGVPGEVIQTAPTTPSEPVDAQSEQMRFVDAISAGLKQALTEHADLVFMGQDIAEYGGVFKISEGFVEEFGKERIRNTPICESGILGAALGLSIRNMKAIVEMQFADFVTCGFNQIINNLGKSYWRWGQNADVVIRMPTGAGVGAGPFHSQSNERWFYGEPGLKVVYPAYPQDAASLLVAAVNDPNPVLFFEHKALYRSLEGEVVMPIQPAEIGKAVVRSKGDTVTVITYGMGVHWAMEHAETDDRIEVLDLRSLAPIDWQSVFASVQRTGKVIVLHEDALTGGIGGELSARINEVCFECLDAPVQRVGSLDTPIPFNKGMESNYLASARFSTVLQDLLDY